MTICDCFQKWAAEAVEDWDGQDNNDLLEALAVTLGVPFGQMVAEAVIRLEFRRREAEEKLNPIDSSS